MKLKRLLPIFALALCVMMLFTSCFGGMKIDKKLASGYYETNSMTAKPLTAYDGYELVSSSSTGDLAVFRKETSGYVNYHVYNLRKESELSLFSLSYSAEQLTWLSVKGIAPVTIRNYNVVEIAYMASETATPTYSYYDATGAQIVLNTDERATFINDCMVHDNVVRRFDADTYTISVEYDKSELSGVIPSADEWNEKYYYVYDGGISIYDAEYNYISTYNKPSYARDFDWFVFDDGYVVAQYFVELDPTAEKYDLYEGDKYDLVTVRINPKNGKVSEIDTDYVIDAVAVPEEDDTYSILGKVDNFVTVYEIVDGQLDESSAAKRYCDLNSKLKGKRIWEYNEQNVYPSFAGAGYVVLRSNEVAWLFTAKGKEVGQVTGAREFTEKFIVTNTAIYDYELNKLSDFNITTETSPLTFKQTLGSNLIFESATNYYIYNGSSNIHGDLFVLLGEKANVTVSYTMYSIKDTVTNKYTYYDASGAQVITSTNATASVVATSYASNAAETNVYLYRAYGIDGTTVQYYLLKAGVTSAK